MVHRVDVAGRHGIEMGLPEENLKSQVTFFTQSSPLENGGTPDIGNLVTFPSFDSPGVSVTLTAPSLSTSSIRITDCRGI